MSLTTPVGTHSCLVDINSKVPLYTRILLKKFNLYKIESQTFCFIFIYLCFYFQLLICTMHSKNVVSVSDAIVTLAVLNKEYLKHLLSVTCRSFLYFIPIMSDFSYLSSSAACMLVSLHLSF